MNQNLPEKQLRSSKPWCLLLSLAMFMACPGCRQDAEFPSRPITIICPWAAGGGTDRVSRRMAMHLEQELNVPVSVVNATGGKGVTGHNRGLNARADGYTLTMMTFELNTMHWMGLTDLTYQDCKPLLSVNEDYAALLVAASAEWRSLQELEAEIRTRLDQQQNGLLASGTASGGAWHLALAGWLDSADLPSEAVTWIPSEGANPSLQQLLSGGVDMVCCSLPEARSLLDSGDVRALGVMSPKRATGFNEVPTFQEQGRDWTLGGWRGLGVPSETPEPVVEKLAAAIERIVSRPAEEGSFTEFMQQQRFDHTWRRPPEFAIFLAENDEKLGKLLNSPALQSITKDRFSPMAYPAILIGLLSLTGAAIFLSSARPSGTIGSREQDRSEPIAGEGANGGRSTLLGENHHGYWAFLVIVLAIAAYAIFAETIGFLIVNSAILLCLLLYLGSRPVIAIGITCLFVPALYLVFDHLLRVPLPRGWLG